MLNLINPKIALKLVQSELSKEFGKDIAEYSICFRQDSDLFFLVDGIKHAWNDSANVKLLIEQLLNQKLPKNLKVFNATITVAENVTVEIEYFDNGELKKITENL